MSCSKIIFSSLPDHITSQLQKINFKITGHFPNLVLQKNACIIGKKAFSLWDNCVEVNKGIQPLLKALANESWPLICRCLLYSGLWETVQWMVMGYLEDTEFSMDTQRVKFYLLLTQSQSKHFARLQFSIKGNFKSGEFIACAFTPSFTIIFIYLAFRLCTNPCRKLFLGPLDSHANKSPIQLLTLGDRIKLASILWWSCHIFIECDEKEIAIRPQYVCEVLPAICVWSSDEKKVQ